MSSGNYSTAIIALIFIFIVVVCIAVALSYNPAPAVVVKEPCNKTAAELLAERVRSRSTPSKSKMTPPSRASGSPFSDASSNNDPWTVLDRLDNERLVRSQSPM